MTLLPTLNRTKLLSRFLKSAIDCETSTPGMIIVDRLDYEANKSHYDLIEKDQLPKDWRFEITEARTMGDKIREVWPKVVASGTRWVNLLNDDHIIRSKGWDVKLISKLDGTNFVTCADNWMSPRKAAGATVFSMKLLETLGFPIYPPGMQHLFIDDLFEAIGYGTGVWDIDHSVLIEHHNQLKDPKNQDSTFRAVYGDGPDITKAPIWVNDEKIYREFLQNEFQSVKNKIRKLRGQIEII